MARRKRKGKKGGRTGMRGGCVGARRRWRDGGVEVVGKREHKQKPQKEGGGEKKNGEKTRREKKETWSALRCEAGKGWQGGTTNTDLWVRV